MTDTLTTGLCFGEGPRWHDGALWLSDMHAHEVLRVDLDGSCTRQVHVPNEPSGLGWMPDGSLLIVSMSDRRLLRWNGRELTEHADLSGHTPFNCNDMVVDSQGRAYVGNFGCDLHAGESPAGTQLILVTPTGETRVVAEDLMFPNGTVITPDGKTLVVGETFGGCLTAFDIQPNGDLTNRSIWAQLPEGALPDGICLDSEGGIWSASPTTNECVRQLKGGEVTHRLATSQGAFACALTRGGASDKLFVLTAPSSQPEEAIAAKGGQVEVFDAPAPGAGLP